MQKIIVVTGGTGYIASWIVKDLLEAGHIVRITVRDKAKVEKYQHLLEVETNSDGILEVFESDLLKKGSFDRVVEGADYVMHTASPFLFDDGGDPQKNLVDPAVKGTKNVLSSVDKSSSVQRVVLTSSMVAMCDFSINIEEQQVKAIDESMWNTSSSVEHGAYSYSKTQAERAAWAMNEAQEQWSLVTIHPGLVLGPSMTRRVDSTSIDTMLSILHGEPAMPPNLQLTFSDVRDVSKGHILAAFTSEARGRYIIANEHRTINDMEKYIQAAYGTKYQVPERHLTEVLDTLAADNTKSLKELGMRYHSFKDTVIDHVDQLQKDGLI